MNQPPPGCDRAGKAEGELIKIYLWLNMGLGKRRRKE